jgi:hypothetical protein
VMARELEGACDACGERLTTFAVTFAVPRSWLQRMPMVGRCPTREVWRRGAVPARRVVVHDECFDPDRYLKID